MGTGRLMWSEQESVADVATVAELDAQLDALDQVARRGRPTIVSLSAHGRELTFGLGARRCVVQWEEEPGGPYMVTRGDDDTPGVMEFFLHGEHHTEILRRNLIPAEQVRQVVREFFETGRRSDTVAWELVGPSPGEKPGKKTMEQDILDARRCQVTVGEVEADLPIHLRESQDWRDLKRQMLADDELWYFRTPEDTWTTAFPRCGMEGYALVRGGRVVEMFLLSIS